MIRVCVILLSLLLAFGSTVRRVQTMSASAKDSQYELVANGTLTVTAGSLLVVGFASDNGTSGWVVEDNLGHAYTLTHAITANRNLDTVCFTAPVSEDGEVTSVTVRWLVEPPYRDPSWKPPIAKAMIVTVLPNANMAVAEGYGRHGKRNDPIQFATLPPIDVVSPARFIGVLGREATGGQGYVGSVNGSPLVQVHILAEVGTQGRTTASNSVIRGDHDTPRRV